MNISLPMEQFANPYISQDMVFEFHYFFMRKFWFVYLAKGLIVFPGGFGTLDEFFELITLVQTKKVLKDMCIILYGTEYWHDLINFDKMVKYGMISESDLSLFHTVDDVDTAFKILKNHLKSRFSSGKQSQISLKG
ncbi:MAG: LOG family protein YvdD [bacterium ADurb.Bin478]|nr:MAG: LOG family protein YvdD [bacterium ADurb.Bin478]